MAVPSLHIQSARRSKIETRADILRAIRMGPCGKEIPTRIMYKSNLSWTVLRDHFKDLLVGKFIEVALKGERPSNKSAWYIDGPEHSPRGGKIYSLTERGRIWLESFDLLNEEMFPSEQPLAQAPQITEAFQA